MDYNPLCFLPSEHKGNELIFCLKVTPLLETLLQQHMLIFDNNYINQASNSSGLKILVELFEGLMIIVFPDADKANDSSNKENSNLSVEEQMMSRMVQNTQMSVHDKPRKEDWEKV